MTVLLRAEVPEDEPFVRRLILETITQELGAQAWPQRTRDHILGLQYRSRRAGAETGQIIVANGEDVGWACISDRAEQIRILEIMVSPEHRRNGVGAAVIEGILASARSAQKPVRLAVNATNIGAIHLYQKLGFRQTGSDQVQHQMEWTPPR